MKTRDLLKLLRRDGWRVARVRGSHYHFKHPVKPGIVTVPVKRGADVPLGTLKSILRQAGLL